MRIHPQNQLPHAPKKRKKGRLMRFFRGYLMCVGALATGYMLIQLLVLLLVEVAKWM